MNTQDRNQVIDELIGMVENQCGVLILQIDKFRRNVISALQAMRNEDEIDEQIAEADEILRLFDKFNAGGRI